MNMFDLVVGLLLLPAVIIDAVSQVSVKFETETRNINNREFIVYTADTPEKWQQGFKGKVVLDNEAMVFEFPSQSIKTFWMKGTKSALDIVYLDKDFRITKIVHSATPCRLLCKPYIGVANFVVEFKAGIVKELGLKKGQNFII